MCTAATYQTKDFYMGRTLDYEFSYGEQIAIIPRNYPIKFHYAGTLEHHYACIGMAHVANGYPLYYDAANEKGLGMAGLNFVSNAAYADVDNEKENVCLLYTSESESSVSERFRSEPGYLLPGS